MKPHVFWPAALIGLLVLGVAANVVLLFVASNDPSFAVEEDYYRKAIEWDAKREQDRANAALGWTASVVTRPELEAGAPMVRVELALAGSDGTPVEGADVRIEAFHLARSAVVLKSHLAQTPEGVYAAFLPMRRPGLWELRVEAVRDGARFTHREQRDVDTRTVLSRAERTAR